jgi:hypothetical protein
MPRLGRVSRPLNGPLLAGTEQDVPQVVYIYQAESGHN